MSERHGGPAALAQVWDRIRARIVGRERELDLLLAAVAAGRDILLEGPPGTSPLVEAMRSGGFLYIEEFNRAPEDTLNALLTAMAERRIAVPRAGEVIAKDTFRVIASMNPYDNIGTTRLSTSVHDRLCRLAITYQDDKAERGIVGRGGARPPRTAGRAASAGGVNGADTSAWPDEPGVPATSRATRARPGSLPGRAGTAAVRLRAQRRSRPVAVRGARDLGRGRLRQIRTYRDVAPALSEFFAS